MFHVNGFPSTHSFLFLIIAHTPHGQQHEHRSFMIICKSNFYHQISTSEKAVCLRTDKIGSVPRITYKSNSILHTQINVLQHNGSNFRNFFSGRKIKKKNIAKIPRTNKFLKEQSKKKKRKRFIDNDEHVNFIIYISEESTMVRITQPPCTTFSHVHILASPSMMAAMLRLSS